MHLPTISLSLLALLASVSASALPQTDSPADALFGRPSGIDSGNIICGGACVSDPELLDCPHIEFRPQRGCYECCLSDDDLDGDFIKFDELDE
ncbi:hypothetical protein BDV18DRAFT_160515 [Aspergillus unguis]